jgi:FXSXX-COOH protein
MEEPAAGPPSDLVDASRLTLAEVRKLDRAVLADCLERILRDTDRGADAVAGFQSSL